jgi:5,10-methylenetetrahydromethanopterin reductase
VLEAAGHAAAVMLHASMEQRRPEMIQGGKEWAAAYDAVPARVRHLALHDRHLIAINDRNRPFVTGAMLVRHGVH